MKTNRSAVRITRLWLTLGVIALTALAAFDIWTASYCCRNLKRAAQTQSTAPPAWDVQVNDSVLWLAAR